MSMPPDSTGIPDGTQAQILLKLGEISTQVAVISKVLEALPDHEQRIRSNERAISALRVESKTSRDNVSRYWAFGATAAALGSGVAAWVSVLHHH